MTSFLKMFDQTVWKHDLEAYWRYKKLAEKATTPRIIELCKESMKRLQDRWPNHKME